MYNESLYFLPASLLHNPDGAALWWIRFNVEYNFENNLFFKKCFIFSFNRIPSSAETQVAGFDPVWAYYLCSKIKDLTR